MSPSVGRSPARDCAGNHNNLRNNTPKRGGANVRTNLKNRMIDVPDGGGLNKSPSDTTIYAPAFAKSPKKSKELLVSRLNNAQLNQMEMVASVNKISEFLEQMRLESGVKNLCEEDLGAVADAAVGTVSQVVTQPQPMTS